jgi:hypothetical protein
MEKFVYNRRDLYVTGVALAIVVAILGLGFGLGNAAPISTEEPETQKGTEVHSYQGLNSPNFNQLVLNIVLGKAFLVRPQNYYSKLLHFRGLLFLSLAHREYQARA